MHSVYIQKHILDKTNFVYYKYVKMVVINLNLFPAHWKGFLPCTLPVYVEKPIF